MHAFTALASTWLITSTLAHMALDYPPPFNASNNPHRATPADPYLQYPYDCCGQNDRWEYPCRGYHKLLGSPEGAPTATWGAGSVQTWTISGIGNHFGGSCQVGFSTDGGNTFRVATSYEGNCPHRRNGDGPSGQSFEFTIPQDLETGVQIFAWMWYNREQEFNMNCAAVNITATTPSNSLSTTSTRSVLKPSISSAPTYRPSQYCKLCYCDDFDNCTCTGCASSSKTLEARDIAYNDRPLMFVADDGNDCLTPHTTAELKYPHPGPDIVRGDGVYPLELPSGACDPERMLMKQAYNGVTGNDGHF